MPNETFETYFSTRPALTGAQASSGDDELVLRSGSVFKGNRTNILGAATITGNAVATTITLSDTYYPVTGFSLVSTTASMTFANDAFSYIGPNQVLATKFKFAATLTGVDAKCQVSIHINGLPISNGMNVTVTTAGFAYVSADVLAVLVAGDVITAEIRNRTDTNDIVVSDAQFNVG